MLLWGVVSVAPAARGAFQSAGVAEAPAGDQSSGMHRPLDEILDLYVRDGYVYYRALRLERGKLDRHVASLNVAAETHDRWSPNEQVAFWLNAYNAFVLRTVIDHYPILGRSSSYPSNSIRQIPGAFDRLPHRAAGRSVTLDEIELHILPAYKDPRVYFALGRGAAGSPRLRSEAFTAARLDAQLADATAEFATKPRHVRIDQTANQVTVSPIVGWREHEFVAAYGDRASGYPGRSPIERAILAIIEPHLFPSERAFLKKNEFKIRYHEFDWSLNDLTGGRGSGNGH